MDASLKEIWSALQKEPAATSATEPSSPVEVTLPGGRTPEEMRRQASTLAAEGLRREAADLLRSAVNLAEELEAEPRRQIPILEALAEVLWQLGDKQEARIRANRAIEMWFRARPTDNFDDALNNADPAASSAA
jgi:hypothetical protein